jgi:hypothetical protein
VALEVDEAIFKALLHPMIQTTNTATLEIIPTSPLVDDDEEPMLLPKVKHAHTCAYICLVIDFSSSPFIFNFYCHSHYCHVHSNKLMSLHLQQNIESTPPFVLLCKG